MPKRFRNTIKKLKTRRELWSYAVTSFHKLTVKFALIIICFGNYICLFGFHPSPHRDKQYGLDPSSRREQLRAWLGIIMYILRFCWRFISTHVIKSYDHKTVIVSEIDPTFDSSIREQLVLRAGSGEITSLFVRITLTSTIIQHTRDGWYA